MVKALVVSFLISVSAWAGEIQLDVFGRTYVNSCGYFSNISGDYSVNFASRMLPWGTRIFVVSGWKGYNYSGGRQYDFDWAYRTEQEAVAVAPYEWRADIRKALHNRTSGEMLTHLQYSIRVEVPNRQPVYYPMIAWAYYEAQVAGQGLPGPLCVSGEADRPRYQRIPHKIIERN